VHCSDVRGMGSWLSDGVHAPYTARLAPHPDTEFAPYTAGPYGLQYIVKQYDVAALSTDGAIH